MTPKAFHIISAQIGSVSTRVDKSVGFRVTTGELKPDMMAQLCGLSGLAVSLFIQPHEYDGKDAVEVTSEAEPKSPSQRLRAVLFVWHKQMKSTESFSSFYERQISLVIEKIKEKLDTCD